MQKDISLIFVCLLAACSSDAGRRVSKDEFSKEGKVWPLTVEVAFVGCTGGARWVKVDGEKYGLNGFATEKNGYSDLTTVWGVDQKLQSQLKEAFTKEEYALAPTMRLNIGDLSEEASKYCE